MVGEKYGMLTVRKEFMFLKNHRYDGTLLIEGGKYDNSDWYLDREIERVKKAKKNG